MRLLQRIEDDMMQARPSLAGGGEPARPGDALDGAAAIYAQHGHVLSAAQATAFHDAAVERDCRYTLLQHLGWVAIILGVGQLIAAASLLAGGGFGRWVGILFAGLSAIYALLAIPAYPFWSLCIFALAIIVVYELAKPRENTSAT